jgi:hypothetical protein
MLPVLILIAALHLLLPASVFSQTMSQSSAQENHATTQDAPPQTARSLRLRAETSHLNDLAAQLQQALDKSGKDQLSLEVVRLSEQIESLSKQIEWELRNP